MTSCTMILNEIIEMFFLPDECDEICLKIANLLKLEKSLKEYQVATTVKQSKAEAFVFDNKNTKASSNTEIKTAQTSKKIEKQKKK